MNARKRNWIVVAIVLAAAAGMGILFIVSGKPSLPVQGSEPAGHAQIVATAVSTSDHSEEEAHSPLGETAAKTPVENQQAAGSEAGSAELQELYQQLEDPEAAKDPGAICAELMKTKGNAESVRAIKRYIERKERPDNCMTRIKKASALQNIGYIGGPEASALLRRVFTEEGARELTKAWLQDPVPEDTRKDVDNRLWTICSYRKQAAIGLAHTGIPEDMEEVEKEYHRIAEIRMQDDRYSRPWKDVADTFTDEEKRRDSLFNGLVSAMAEREAMAETGQPLPPDMDISLPILMPYIEKYYVPPNPDLN